MFSLTDADCGKRILGCADGPASFNAEAAARGMTVVSADPLYRFTADEIQTRIEATVPVISAELRANQHEFVWEHFASADAVIGTRIRAMRAFIADYEIGSTEERYVDAALPELPFGDRAFDLALCSHFLFLYSGRHDCDFHVRSILELCRMASEARVYPLLELGSVRSRHVEAVIERLSSYGLVARIEPVDYEFQRRGNEMLRITGLPESGRRD
jgi:hypothetical protein